MAAPCPPGRPCLASLRPHLHTIPLNFLISWFVRFLSPSSFKPPLSTIEAEQLLLLLALAPLALQQAALYTLRQLALTLLCLLLLGLLPRPADSSRRRWPLSLLCALQSLPPLAALWAPASAAAAMPMGAALLHLLAWLLAAMAAASGVGHSLQPAQQQLQAAQQQRVARLQHPRRPASAHPASEPPMEPTYPLPGAVALVFLPLALCFSGWMWEAQGQSGQLAWSAAAVAAAGCVLLLMVEARHVAVLEALQAYLGLAQGLLLLMLLLAVMDALFKSTGLPLLLLRLLLCLDTLAVLYRHLPGQTALDLQAAWHQLRTRQGLPVPLLLCAATAVATAWVVWALDDSMAWRWPAYSWERAGLALAVVLLAGVQTTVLIATDSSAGRPGMERPDASPVLPTHYGEDGHRSRRQLPQFVSSMMNVVKSKSLYGLLWALRASVLMFLAAQLQWQAALLFVASGLLALPFTSSKGADLGQRAAACFAICGVLLVVSMIFASSPVSLADGRKSPTMVFFASFLPCAAVLVAWRAALLPQAPSDALAACTGHFSLSEFAWGMIFLGLRPQPRKTNASAESAAEEEGGEDQEVEDPSGFSASNFASSTRQRHSATSGVLVDSPAVTVDIGEGNSAVIASSVSSPLKLVSNLTSVFQEALQSGCSAAILIYLG